jgi:6-pyruvoyltetrahydropterin/6-carboxytetrahydropterin synthase
MRAVRRLEFDTAHRVANHESKCATLHGHRYVVEAYAEGRQLDSVGRVIDFSEIKKRLGTWLDHNWDHTSIIWKEDKETLAALESIPKHKSVFASEWNPTAENMAHYLLNEICPFLFIDTGIEITKIRLYETPNCYVEVGV